MSECVAHLVAGWGEDAGFVDGYSPVGAVVGATFPEELEKLRLAMPNTPFPRPGIRRPGGERSRHQECFWERWSRRPCQRLEVNYLRF